MNLTAKQFDLGNARACARASAFAYQTATISAPDTDTHCLIEEKPDCIVIAFRGTSSIRNWITDAQFERTTLIAVNTTVSKIHKGFERAFNSIFEELLTALGGCSADKMPNQKPLCITGHSLGGALAILAALELWRNGCQIAQVYTFGQPRLGNADFKDRYDHVLGYRTFRLVFQEDIVPRIPHLPAWHDPYRHVGIEVFIPSIAIPHSAQVDTGDLWINPPFWRLLISDLWGIYRAFIVSKFAAALDPIVDHHVNNYIAALDKVTDPLSTPTTPLAPENATPTPAVIPAVQPSPETKQQES
ncbi:lipase family protein [Silvimonas sp.]|uniref:lipase family protein n=1 Tax=Silvimonas sp. TaxID=2650811 RepID=UPI002850287A|nr:lipase family protein [Silvimonas sp.]MDR3427841.1 lipase family protein [Silvimonas sp.]